MRQYSQGENGLKWVSDALKDSEYLEVDDTGLKVRRKTEVKEPKGQFERSVYAVSNVHLPLNRLLTLIVLFIEGLRI